MRANKTLLATAGVAALTLAAAAPALAHTMDDAGKGFVGKGEVQIAFDWNNKRLQAAATSVAFTHESVERYAATCTFVTGEGTKGQQVHNVDRHSTQRVSGSVDADPRAKNSKFAGFVLKGFSGTPVTTGGAVPSEGDAGPGGGPVGGTYTSVEQVSSDTVLFATHEGVKNRL